MIEDALQLRPINGVPIANAGQDPEALIRAGLKASGVELRPTDVLVVASKLLSRCEGRFVDLTEVQPSARAVEVAARCEKDPRLVELILRESVGISRVAPGVLIVRHRIGIVSANAGIDSSNVGGDRVLLLPLDPDASARSLSEALGVPVVITDSLGRPFRRGTVGCAIGCYGLPPLLDQRGAEDLFGRVLEHTETALADQLAAAADLVAGQAGEGRAVVLVRGLRAPASEVGAADLVRDPQQDLYA